MIVADTIAPFVPWLVIAAALAAGYALSLACRWGAYVAQKRHWRGRSVFAALRGAVVLYAVAIGIELAPFDFSHQPKRELQVDRMIEALVIVASTIVASRLAVSFVHALGRRHGERFPSSTLFANIAQIVAMLIGVLILLQSLNIAIAPILTALGVGGLAVALALQDTLANLFAGIQIVAAHQLRPGDYIKLDSGAEGYVEDIAWRNTTMRELGNNLIVVPNAKLSQSIFTNYSQRGHTIISVDITIGFGQDLARVEQFAAEVAKSVSRELGATDEEPYVRFRQLSDSGMLATTFFAVGRNADRFRGRSLFNERFYEKSVSQGVLVPRQSWAEAPAPPPPAAQADSKP